MVVILIIGLLATIVVQNLRSATDKAKRVKAQADISQLKSALDRFYLDVGSYPTSDQGLGALMSAPTNGNNSPDWAGPYVEKIPLDPWGHPYVYQSDGNAYLLKSYGADGVEGGEGKNADIDGSSTG
jgi:general secretion pathway protein G